MSFEREIDIPFNVVSLDKIEYIVPHGMRLDTTPLINSGVDKIKLINRNVTVTYNKETFEGNFKQHPSFPVDEFLNAPGVPPLVVRFSKKLLEVLSMTMEAIYDYYSVSDDRLKEVDPSQLSISRGKLMVGESPPEPMMAIWTGTHFAVMPLTTKLLPTEEMAEEVTGSVIGNKFRCKYGILDIYWR